MRHEEGVVKVRFVIDRAGMLIEGRVISSSGRASLDEEAAAMLHRASPYPKAPSDISGDRIEFTAPVEFVLPV
jgi:protein TonB